MGTFEDKYELGKRLRSGSYGVVYTCHPKDNKEVTYAVKDIDRKKIKVKEGESIFREVEVMKQLADVHGIVGLIDFFEEPNNMYMVLVFAAGGDVFDRLSERTKYTEENARDLAHSLLGAIKGMHEVKPYPIIHRDLKPENLLLRDPDDDSSVLLADFGFARPVTEDRCDTRCGTPSYVAPEVMMGRKYSIEADLWSTGCILYMLLCGHSPFQAENHRELFRKIRAGDYVFHEKYFKNVSVDAKHLLGTNLLAVDPESRMTAPEALECDWFKSKDMDTHDLSSNIGEFKKLKAKKKWKVAAQVIGFVASAPFWNPDAVSFQNQVEAWDTDYEKTHEKEVEAEKNLNPATAAHDHLMSKVSHVRFLDVYELKKKIRKGAFATVWECVFKPTGDLYAVKVINRKGLKAKDDENVLNEVAMMQSMSGNKYVVELMDFYEETDCFYLVMEHLPGGDVFDQILTMTHYTEKDARDLAINLLKGVANIHKAGIAHRDIKPQNLLLKSKDDPSSIKFTDFGFARRVHTPCSLTNRVGTPTYVAPELLKNIPHDQRADLWSVGVVLYVLLCGYPPFLEEDQEELFLKIRTGDWQFFPEDWENISESARELIKGLIVVDMRKRWSIEEALRCDWIKQDPAGISNVQLTKSIQTMKSRKQMLRSIAKAYMLIGKGSDTKTVDIETQAQDDL